MIGTSLNQDQITASIGVGGMGEVFRARDTQLNRDVAVKVLPKEQSPSWSSHGQIAVHSRVKGGSGTTVIKPADGSGDEQVLLERPSLFSGSRNDLYKQNDEHPNATPDNIRTTWAPTVPLC